MCDMFLQLVCAVLQSIFCMHFFFCLHAACLAHFNLPFTQKALVGECNL